MAGGGGEGAGRCGHALAAFLYFLKHLGNASQVWVVGVVRARGGVGTHWQPLNTLETPRKCEPGLCSGKRRLGGVWAVGVVRARGGVGTHWQPLNTL